MFDTPVYVEKPVNYMIAATHNNNDGEWITTYSADSARILYLFRFYHYLTSYVYCNDESTSSINPFLHPDTMLYMWCKKDPLPWREWGLRMVRNAFIFFPILDTLYGTPCAAVSDVRTAEVDSTWMTLMWNADGRHHLWEVEYGAQDSVYCDTVVATYDTVVTTLVPTAMLSGLMPGTGYSVRVRGLCDQDNWSPWSDTLWVVTPRDTTADTLSGIDSTVIHHLDIARQGNLERFTRIMPNPAGGQVQVISSYRLEKVTVFDLNGRKVLEQESDGIVTSFDVRDLPSGTYIVAVHTLQGVATKKLTVSR